MPEIIPPKFVTFTGLDQWTDLERVVSISQRWPVEWGVLFSPTRSGKDPRYPSLRWLEESLPYLRARGVRLAAHLCGYHAEEVMVTHPARVWSVHPLVTAPNFERLQVNHKTPDWERIARFAEHRGLRGIAQTRALNFPRSSRIDWLYDTSGGRGKMPDHWPKPRPTVFCGYAGGLDPANVGSVVSAISSWSPYWLDMETGVRTDNRLDLDKCAAVCAEVFSEPKYKSVPMRSQPQHTVSPEELRPVAGPVAGKNGVRWWRALSARIALWLGRGRSRG